MIKAVIFDYFGVISSDEYWHFVKQDKNAKSGFHELAEEVNLGELSWRDFLSEVANKTNQPIERVANLYESERINPKVLSLAAELKTKGYKTAILTNAHHEFLDPIIRQADLNKIFDHIIISSRVGFIKPNPDIFESALTKLKTEPSQTVFLDDIDRHVQAARSHGIHAIHYKSFDQAKSELDQILANSD